MIVFGTVTPLLVIYLYLLYNRKKKKEINRMNIWHNISPDRVKPNCFEACIEIEKGSKVNTSWIKKPACSNWTVFSTLPPTTLPAMVLSLAPMPTIWTLWMCWCSAPSPFAP